MSKDTDCSAQGGLEATAKIRRHEQKFGRARTPIIALTAHAMMGNRQRCLQAQMDEYLTKPLQQNLLIETILKYATQGCESRP
jgi:osomolarity two-component system sensor histidine kinase NIK1